MRRKAHNRILTESGIMALSVLFASCKVRNDQSPNSLTSTFLSLLPWLNLRSNHSVTSDSLNLTNLSPSTCNATITCVYSICGEILILHISLSASLVRRQMSLSPPTRSSATDFFWLVCTKSRCRALYKDEKVSSGIWLTAATGFPAIAHAQPFLGNEGTIENLHR